MRMVNYVYWLLLIETVVLGLAEEKYNGLFKSGWASKRPNK